MTRLRLARLRGACRRARDHRSLVRRFVSYQYAEVQKRVEVVHSALITDDDGQGGVYLYLMAQQSGQVFPFSRGWCATEAEAKRQCLQDFGIRDSDWRIEDGDPEWAGAFRAAVDDAIQRYLKAVQENQADGVEPPYLKEPPWGQSLNSE